MTDRPHRDASAFDWCHRGGSRGTSRAAKKRARKPDALTTAQLRELIKPRPWLRDAIGEIVREWKTSPELKIEGLTWKKLERLGAVIEKKRAREADLSDKQARQLAPVTDARLVADAAGMGAVLSVSAGVKFHGRKHPTLIEKFAALADHLAHESPADDERSDEEVSESGRRAAEAAADRGARLAGGARPDVSDRARLLADAGIG